MNTKRLQYFLVIAETLNITKAAERLHMSQPPLTQQLKLLEEELGVSLFKRTTRQLTLTEAGQKLQGRGQQILELMAITVSELDREDVKEIGIGFVASSASLLSPDVLNCFHDAYESIPFNLKEGNTHQILDFLDHGLIDIGLVRTPFNGEKYYIDYLELEPMIAVFNPKSYQFTDTIQLNALKELPLVLDKRFLELIVDTAHQSGFEPDIICKGEDSRSILAWAEAGLGVALLPYSGRGFIKNDDLTYVTIEASALETRTALVTLKSNTSKLVLDLIGMINKRP